MDKGQTGLELVRLYRGAQYLIPQRISQRCPQRSFQRLRMSFRRATKYSTAGCGIFYCTTRTVSRECLDRMGPAPPIVLDQGAASVAVGHPSPPPLRLPSAPSVIPLSFKKSRVHASYWHEYFFIDTSGYFFISSSIVMFFSSSNGE